MSGTEIKKALMDGCPVSYDGTEYLKVSAIIYRNYSGTIKVSAELMDKNKNSLVIVPIEKVAN